MSCSSSLHQQQIVIVGQRTEGPARFCCFTLTNPVPLSQTIPCMSSRNFVEAMFA